MKIKATSAAHATSHAARKSWGLRGERIAQFPL
jgi:hypothetical protein